MNSGFRKISLVTCLLALSAVSLQAYATNPVANADSDARAAAGAAAVSGSRSSVDASLVSASQAVTGDSSANSESSAGSTNVIDASTNYQRQVPALIMGTVIPVDCGFGGQAGGANTNAAGFLGASWTTDRCYTLKVANAWAAMGEYEYACEMLMDVSRRAAKRRNIADVDCNVVGIRLRADHTVTPVAPAAPRIVQDPNYVTQDQLKEALDRAFKKAVAK